MKLLKETEKKNEVVVVKPQTSNEVLGLKAFVEKYPNNATTPLVYFEDGMAPVASPFTTIIPLSKQIAESDPAAVKKFVDQGAYRELEGFMRRRRHSILEQFRARANFLSRTLAFNIEQKIFEAIRESAAGGYGYMQSMIEDVVERIAPGFYRGVTSATFGSLDEDRDFLTSYVFNTTSIPQIVAEVYDMYDKLIVESISHHVSKRESAEEIHMDILTSIIPVFEMLKSQLEWMFYMLRSEAETIYRPMALIPVEDILEEEDERRYKEFITNTITNVTDEEIKAQIAAATERGDDVEVNRLLDKAIDEGKCIQITTF